MKNLYAVHVTNNLPVEKQIAGGMATDEVSKYLKYTGFFPDSRVTLHWSLGSVVPDSHSREDAWSKRKFAIITNLENLYPYMLGVYCYDTVTLGDYIFTNQDHVLVPLGTVIDKNAKFIVHYYNPATTTINNAVSKLILELGGILVNYKNHKGNLGDPAFITTSDIASEININTPFYMTSLLRDLKVSFGTHELSITEGWGVSYLRMLEKLYLSIFMILINDPNLLTYYSMDMEQTDILLTIFKHIVAKTKEHVLELKNMPQHSVVKFTSYIKQQEDLVIHFLTIQKELLVNNRTLFNCNINVRNQLIDNMQNILGMRKIVADNLASFPEYKEEKKHFSQVMIVADYLAHFSLADLVSLKLDTFLKDKNLMGHYFMYRIGGTKIDTLKSDGTGAMIDAYCQKQLMLNYYNFHPFIHWDSLSHAEIERLKKFIMLYPNYRQLFIKDAKQAQLNPNDKLSHNVVEMLEFASGFDKMLTSYKQLLKENNARNNKNLKPELSSLRNTPKARL